jgi:aldose sugar dehydrogenase
MLGSKKMTISLIAVLVGLFGFAVFSFINKEKNTEPLSNNSAETDRSNEIPKLKTEVIASGLVQPWDVAITDKKEIFYSEKKGSISTIDEGRPSHVANIDGVVSRGEGGLMGIAIDPEFASNSYIYACFYTGTDIRLARFKVSDDRKSLNERKDIITGMPAKDSGRHSGCRPRFGPDKNLWIGTGDAANGTHPQDPKSLGGKVLRIDREGRGVAGNLSEPFDERIYSYGHRNVQGMAMFKKIEAGSYGYSVEHGSNRDDEANALVPGNFGWDPVPEYNESVDMTDSDKFPEAIKAVWSSGSPTIAPSGATMIYGNQWQAYNGTLAIAVLKDQHVRILSFSNDGKLAKEQEVLTKYGRIRSIVQAPDGSLYITTDNKDDDKIIRVTPV